MEMALGVDSGGQGDDDVDFVAGHGGSAQDGRHERSSAKVNMPVVLLMVGLLVLMTKSLVELIAIGVGCGKGCG